MIIRAISAKNTKTFRSPIRQFRNVSLTILSFLMFLVVQQDLKAADAANGDVLFKANCARCHSGNLQVNSTGPALFGIFERVPSREWLYPWIKNSAAVIATGDDYAVKIWEDNNKSPMQAMPHLTDENIDDILAWIEAWTPPVKEEGASDVKMFGEDEGLSSMRNAIILLVLVIVSLLGFIALQAYSTAGPIHRKRPT